MNNMEKIKDLVEYMIKELDLMQSEITIQKALFSTELDIESINSPIDLLEQLLAQNEVRSRYLESIKFLEGKAIAYMNVIDRLNILT